MYRDSKNTVVSRLSNVLSNEIGDLSLDNRNILIDRGLSPDKSGPLTSYSLNESQLSKLLPYLPVIDGKKGLIVQESIIIFIARIYGDNWKVVRNMNIHYPDHPYYRYYVVLNRLSMKSSIDVEYIEDIYDYLFKDMYDSTVPMSYLDIRNNHVIQKGLKELDSFNIDRKAGVYPSVCPISVASEISSKIVLSSKGWTSSESIVILYLIANFCLMYVGYTVIVPIYEVQDLLNILNGSRRLDSLKNCLGKKIMYGMDYCIDQLKEIGHYPVISDDLVDV